MSNNISGVYCAWLRDKRRCDRARATKIGGAVTRRCCGARRPIDHQSLPSLHAGIRNAARHFRRRHLGTIPTPIRLLPLLSRFHSRYSLVFLFSCFGGSYVRPRHRCGNSFASPASMGVFQLRQLRSIKWRGKHLLSRRLTTIQFKHESSKALYRITRIYTRTNVLYREG